METGARRGRAALGGPFMGGQCAPVTGSVRLLPCGIGNKKGPARTVWQLHVGRRQEKMTKLCSGPYHGESGHCACEQHEYWQRGQEPPSQVKHRLSSSVLAAPSCERLPARSRTFVVRLFGLLP